MCKGVATKSNQLYYAQKEQHTSDLEYGVTIL